jgi:hypothetical protein
MAPAIAPLQADPDGSERRASSFLQGTRPSRHQPMSELLERGVIYFFYWPRVDHEQVRGLEDVQRFQLVLRPRDQALWRMLLVGRKRLPAVGPGHERFWAFVDKVARSPRELADELDRQTYQTKTRGERVQPEARPAGEGRYVIADHEGHTHLAYQLVLPHRPGPVQDELRIEERASYIVVVRNPDAPAPPQMSGARRDPDLSPDERAGLGRWRFQPLAPELLDHEGIELVLIAASTAPEEELGIHIAAEAERETEAAIFRDLELEAAQHPLEPLFTGDWR